ncbi:hypothetical protein PUNSTDRAFT_121067 [Punctularia strigosozonata HHB-11173 SS5]|uniref:uncharacterized protein n=1 Tax=Punctularia strigosozonata (strain HHB-11173) TaxID=741275 RepID=UPI000441816D|nr:uncharacterized protein PUNSTDRAFT_121067 [Punctularia strigosozonata HHB-11173 SS5]EIN07865.1 hypothetical protein PUNSTDRAFT_121067 [Punctularia strigosozonata HHB-11173 SS5]
MTREDIIDAFIVGKDRVFAGGEGARPRNVEGIPPPSRVAVDADFYESVDSVSEVLSVFDIASVVRAGVKVDLTYNVE